VFPYIENRVKTEILRIIITIKKKNT